MNDKSKMELYQRMVDSKVKKYSNGIIELPIKALQEYHDAVGLGPNELCYFTLHLPYYDDGLYNYLLGNDCDEDALVLIMDAYYYDVDTGEFESFSQNKVLEGSIYRRFYDGSAFFCGELRIDHLGRVWLESMTEDNIGAEFCVQFSDHSMGYQMCSEDLSFCARFWFDGEKFTYSPVAVYFYDGPPC
ncbi:hypothetical protein IKQ38_04480 [Candidatus Saccharibacteria bacterium]|nr:hypothetical protein [Candidatus Saccharibacteria bacterium]